MAKIELTDAQIEQFWDFVVGRDCVSMDMENVLDLASTNEYSQWYDNVCAMFSVAVAGYLAFGIEFDEINFGTTPTRENLEDDNYNAAELLWLFEESGIDFNAEVVNRWWKFANDLDEFGRSLGFEC